MQFLLPFFKQFYDKYSYKVQTLKFDIYNMRTYQPYQPNIVNRPANSLPGVIEQFKALDFQNRELLKLAENVQRSTFMSQNGPPPQIIYRLQQELRRNLSVLIQSIREVFMDMDKRLRALAKLIQQQSVKQNTIQQNGMFSYPRENIPRPRQNTFYGANHNPVDPYHSLIERISTLELSLKNTQENQAKLISIIQRMERRVEDQPTITSELQKQLEAKLHKDFSTQHIEKSSSASETSFRLFALRSQIPSQTQSFNRLPTQNQNQSLNYNYGRIKASQKEQIIMNKPKKSLNPFLCFGQVQNESLQPSRIQPQFSAANCQKNYASTHSHRLNFMMNTLTR